jgi:L-fuconolactonase
VRCWWPPSFEGDRNEACLAAAAAYPDRFRVMGRIPLTDPDGPDRIAGWREQPGMLGIRVTFSRGPAPGRLTDGSADWLWPAAKRAGVPIMIFAPGLTAEIGAIAERHPGLRLTVDHLGIRTFEQDDLILDELVKLSTHDNVAVKATSLPRNVTDPYPFTSPHPRIRRVVDAFGPRRVFFGSLPGWQVFVAAGEAVVLGDATAGMFIGTAKYAAPGVLRRTT